MVEEGGSIIGRYPKPVDMKTGTITKEEESKRREQEIKLKGDLLKDEPPAFLNSYARKYYRFIVRELPEGVLCKSDMFLVTQVAECLGRMQQAIEILNDEGLLVEYTNKAGATNIDKHKAIDIYHKYSQMFTTYATRLGLSPVDRSKLALINLTEEEDNLILKALRGEEI